MKQSNKNLSIYDYNDNQNVDDSIIKRLSLDPKFRSNNSRQVNVEHNNSINSNNSIFNMITSTNNSNYNNNLNNMKSNTIKGYIKDNNLINDNTNKNNINFNYTMNNPKKISILEEEFIDKCNVISRKIKLKEKEINDISKTYQALKEKLKNKIPKSFSLIKKSK